MIEEHIIPERRVGRVIILAMVGGKKVLTCVVGTMEAIKIT
jgi:hypothetical protein